MRFVLALILLLNASLPADAQGLGLSFLGHGRLNANDVIGDRRDRWRTGSLAASFVFGPEWTGRLPAMPGQIVEVRFLGEIIAPRRLKLPNAGDRPYAQSLSFGLHTHFGHKAWDFAVGADAVITGPQVRLLELQRFLHKMARFNHVASPQVIAGQIPNGLHGAVVAEAGRSFDLGGAARLRPFAEVRSGVENLVRVGFDLSVGPAGQGELLVRDPVTGYRYRSVRMAGDGFTFVLGGDVAKVGKSLYLPASRNQLSDLRSRGRAGVHWQKDRWRAFYGLTYLGPEFKGQRGGQVIGALNISHKF
ncbi:lipid A-modifier LpxR family protein [Pseudooceanicola sp. MF1-13]|uniref:lipid A-modifier LpxR family protein n=1 Tax=Pseudooceanicola sp. MF1-13 TaxID=3379095 RepID=UPI0038916B2F